MDQDIEIINTASRNEKIKNYILKNKKNFFYILIIIFIILSGYFLYAEIKKKDKQELANKYNQIVIKYNSGDKSNILEDLKIILNKKDKTYSPLSLYFLIDNDLIKSKDEINNYFDLIINEISLEKEIKNLVIYKKALYNSNFENEEKLLKILKPIIDSDSVWKSHALYLMAEYFYSKGENQKSLEFFNNILSSESSNKNIKKEALKRIQRDLGE